MAKDTAPNSEGKRKPSARRQAGAVKKRWQERLLPIMGGLLIGLTIFFFLASLIQMTYLHTSIINYPTINLNPERGKDLIASGQNFDEQLQARKVEILASMEAYVVERRYHQASVVLMASLWVRYLGFVTGMILALVGASFVLGKLSEPASEISGKTSLLDFSARSTSPGIILVVLGVVLMFATITDRDKFDVNDGAVYLTNSAEVPGLDLRGPESRPTMNIPDIFLTPEGTPTSVGP